MVAPGLRCRVPEVPGATTPQPHAPWRATLEAFARNLPLDKLSPHTLFFIPPHSRTHHTPMRSARTYTCVHTLPLTHSYLSTHLHLFISSCTLVISYSAPYGHHALTSRTHLNLHTLISMYSPSHIPSLTSKYLLISSNSSPLPHHHTLAPPYSPLQTPKIHSPLRTCIHPPLQTFTHTLTSIHPLRTPTSTHPLHTPTPHTLS